MTDDTEPWEQDPLIVVVNPDDDTSPETVQAFIDELLADDDWVELPVSAAVMIAEDRAETGM